MPVSTAANSETFKVTTTSDTDVCLTRLFDAPRALVFDAMTKPEHIARWWGQLGAGYSVPVCEVDLRVGGKWRFVNRHPKGEVAFHGEYREITPPDRLVYTELMEPYPDGSLVTTTFAEEAGKTRVTVVASYPSKAIRDMVLASGMERGAAVSYDRLEEVTHELQVAA
ncbi:MAG TPA: SRPBCC family protein [Gemmatimonadaceae bacterium]|jgi:uncharacterized protein YndB with AHSA1/START domain|nr:SRPBCC family protein [Gemmatimonadaceae bacterium]